MTEQELQVIKQRAELATPGKWEVRNDNEGTEYRPFYVISEVDADSGEWFAEVHVGCESDAEFIAHARQDVPALIAEIKRLRKVLGFYAEENNNRHKIDLTVGKFDLMSEVTKDEGSKARIALFGVSNE